MAHTTNFKLIIGVVFGVFLLLGVLTLVIAPGSSSSVRGNVVLWGTVEERTMKLVLDPLKTNTLTVTYVEKYESTYQDELVEAFAAGNGPDVFLMSEDMIMRFGNKVMNIPSETISERSFRDTFIEEGELYLSDAGLIALPVFVDPMVLYWNRDSFSSVGVVNPPASWSELLAMVPKFATYSDKGEIIKPAVALGEFANIDHAKDILALLFLQTGSGVTQKTDAGLALDFRDDAAESVLRFYTEFAKPGKDIYTWNRSFASSREEFVAGDLPMYFGYASELALVRERNPHLNIDVVAMPRLSDGGRAATYGAMTGVAVAKSAKNPSGALYVLAGLSSPESMEMFASELGVVPTRKSLLSGTSEDPYVSVFEASALMAKGWLDPESELSYTIFKETTESITGGKARLSEAVYTMKEEMKQLIKTEGFGSGIY
ncbi:MAG: extracellular solute-binding protein [Candidatus Yonathbacteria bacterium]|nr:extracellular solute-binding protein [Candidatus Yonathbacteria bacterium]NTW48041.1 extracellular solute-binding protein [Candidatus Yonathbacteria bacterium]